jgi:hypothetical protein
MLTAQADRAPRILMVVNPPALSRRKACWLVASSYLPTIWPPSLRPQGRVAKTGFRRLEGRVAAPVQQEAGNWGAGAGARRRSLGYGHRGRRDNDRDDRPPDATTKVCVLYQSHPDLLSDRAKADSAPHFRNDREGRMDAGTGVGAPLVRPRTPARASGSADRAFTVAQRPIRGRRRSCLPLGRRIARSRSCRHRSRRSGRDR